MKISTRRNSGKPDLTVFDSDTQEDLASAFINGDAVHIVFTGAGSPKDIQALVLDEISPHITSILQEIKPHEAGNE